MAYLQSTITFNDVLSHVPNWWRYIDRTQVGRNS